jgi:hypothetical protein
MSIPDHARANFQTLLRAAADGNLALMECNDAVTGEPRYVICAVGRDGTDFVFAPFGHLSDGNPYDAYLPPSETLPDRSPTVSYCSHYPRFDTERDVPDVETNNWRAVCGKTAT